MGSDKVGSKVRESGNDSYVAEDGIRREITRKMARDASVSIAKTYLDEAAAELGRNEITLARRKIRFALRTLKGFRGQKED